ncbi:hypothetical protein [Sneathiella glossodoripedis]|uniref:hypothetical protein n=1 Tax=Sneathiella glossodoripedis TaxID=418853 RepID=UPI00131F20D4|nr:hypothetical protein [Sneathiella glossodoripedis]
MARYYMEKYGADVIRKLECDAGICETQGKLHQRNRFLRIRDTILMEFGNELQQEQ